ncbi:MAG: hypothetical protein ACK4SM_05395, partial [Aquificaceae bacterium]
VLASAALFGANSTAKAHANLIPTIKVDGGWVSVVSYVNTMPVPAGGATFVHATYQVKNPNDLTGRCVHLDGRSRTTENDLTTTVLSSADAAWGTVFPAGDTVGSALIDPPGPAPAEGFLVLENYDDTGALGKDGTLTSEAIVFNLGSSFLYSQRALTVTHNAASPGGNVDIEAPGCGNCNYLQAQPFSAGAGTAPGNGTAGTLSRFMFLPPRTAFTSAYVIAINRPGTAEAADLATTVNLVAADYNARIRLEVLMDAAQGYGLGVYNRLEDFRSVTRRNDVVCLAQLSPDQMVDSGLSGFIVDGGWYNISPRCLENEPPIGLQECNGNGAGNELGDAAIIYKVEFARGYGYAVTPQHQQWYAK